ncbi:ATP-binding cassette domain-containing protein [Alphaproteobacteria bacterium]|jgi:simple sugar transport system ATP-binding protein|nr:ATP-binding cassette domain-containing protein [Alphaproteobacteria bacterium]
MASEILELRDIKKNFGSVIALDGVSFDVKPGECHCLLGDNGAGKSTFIKTMSGVHPPSSGDIFFQGEKTTFNSPHDAITRGIATVYQDLGMIPLMSVSRNFFLGNEPTKGGVLKLFDHEKANRITEEEMSKFQIQLRSPEQAVGTLSGGERQTVAIARAVYFGAKVLILDEPTSALGVKQTANVLDTINKMRDKGIAVVFITHNVRHAYAAGDRFTVLDRGKTIATADRKDVSPDKLQNLMAGGKDLPSLED